MQIVVYSKPFFPQMGGLERNTLTLCLALQDNGHQVHLLTETPAEKPDDYPFRVIRTDSVLQFIRVLSGADLLVVNGNVSMRVHPLSWLLQIPYAVIYHNYQGYRRSGDGLGTQLGNQLRGLVARNADANVFTSTYAKNRMQLPDETAHVVLNPVDKRMQQLYTAESENGTEEGASPFLFAGRIIEGKGIFVLARALERLDGEVNARVVIAGEGRHEERLRRQTASLRTIQVDFPGRLSSEALVGMYQNARALVVPSTTHKEGNPLVVAEALFAGTPVIASDQPPMVESVGDAGIIVEQGDAGALASALRTCLGNGDAYRTLRDKAGERASNFSYERYRARIEDVFGSAQRKDE
ncbi:glycosyltransferase family 4 protein [Salinibacter ruber]|uniref:glycosyltransferase family 4 protein n=1 Tax=Salinibacter ruber TaxID=146919 RepID=UPI0020741628|nr:glycosyltransferase family 4 protein [Salinibacter ruber]